LRIILDACSIIILQSGSVLDVVLTIQGFKFAVCPAVRNEVRELSAVITSKIMSGEITELDDRELGANEVSEIAGKHNLGLGEGECLAFCNKKPELAFCTDDKKARAVGVSLLGQKRILSVRELLIQCVAEGLMTSLDAFAAYEQMRARGAYLPALKREDFIL
jgi:predicted nucleic acid-binding protein